MIHKHVRSLILIHIAAVGLLGGVAYGQSVFREGTSKTIINDSANDWQSFEGIAVDSSGNLFIGGCSTNGSDAYANVCKETLQPNGTYVETLAFTEAANGLSHSAFYVAVDSSNNVYIADVYNSRVLKETLSGGSYTQSVVTDYHGGLIFPNQIAVDAAGNVYVTDPDNKRVLKETLSGGAYTQSVIGTGFSQPYAVAVDTAGNVYIGDTGIGAVYKETLSAGTYTQSTIKGGLSGVETLAVDGQGNIYVTGAGTGVLIYAPTATGYFINSQNYLPATYSWGVAVDNAGNVYAAGNYYVEKFNLTPVSFAPVAVGGTGPVVTIPLYSITGYGATVAATELSGAAVSIGATGEFTNTGAGTCDTNGLHQYTVGEMCTLTVTFSPKAAGIRRGAVELVNSSNVVWGTAYISAVGTAPQVAFSSGPQTTVASGLVTPMGVTLNGNGVVSIADPGTRGYLVVETPSGSGYTKSMIDETQGGPLNTSPIPGGVATDGAGNLYFSNSWTDAVYGNFVRALEYYNGAYWITLPLADPQQGNGLLDPTGLAADPNGNVYIADTGNNRVVEELYLPNGTFNTYTALQFVVASGLSAPQAVATDSSSNVYIADTGNNRILVEKPTILGGFTQSVLFNTGLSAPGGVAVDDFGNVFISDTGNKRVLMELRSGAVYSQYVVPVSGLISPQGLAIDPSENLFITDSGSGNVYKVALGTGPTLNFASTNVGSTSSDSPQTVTFSNIGNAPLTFPIPGTGTNPSVSSSFSVSSTGSTACPALTTSSGSTASLAAATSCTLPISFTPAAAGSITGSVKTTDNALNASGTVQTINLNGTGTSPTAPVASLSPTSISFGNQTVSTTSTASTITLSNTGNAALTGITVSITGANYTDFAQTNTCGTTLAASATCTIAVTFTPGSVANFAASVSVSDNAGGSPQTATLTGTGTTAPVPQAVLSPTSLSFGSQLTGTTSNSQSITLSNPGTASLTISSISITGANPTDFAQTNTCGSSLAVSASCTISVTFTPTATASFTAAISVADNATGTPQTTALTGTGIAPQAVLTPTTLAFSNTTVSNTSTSMSTVLSNPGSATLNITGITLVGTNAADFAISANTCGSTLAAAATCNISVTFTPSSATTFTASISIADNAAGSPQPVALSGTGTAPLLPQAVLTPTSLSFPNTTVGNISASLSTVLSNPGNATLNLTSISLAGANSADFAISANTCGSTLAAAATCNISVTFTPSSATTFTASISVADNATGSPQTVILTGTGTPPVATDFTLNSPTPAQSVPPGAPAVFTIDTAALTNGSYNIPIVLTVTGLPTGATAVFTPSTVTPGNGTAAAVLTIQTPSLLATTHNASPSAWFAMLLALPLLLLRRRLRTLHCLLLLAALGSALLVTGCGGGYFGDHSATYTVTITGTSGSIQHSTNITLTVQ